MFLRENLKMCGLVSALGMSVMFLFTGCGSEKIGQQENAAYVKAIQVIQQDTPLSYEYAGQIKGKNEIKVQSRVSGTVVEKYVTGGQYVHAGQPLYKIDSRQYESAVLSAQAALAQSKATLSNAQIDLQRDQELLKSAAVTEQRVTTQQSSVDQYAADVDAKSALVKKAQEDLDDTIIYAPMDGRIDVNDVAVGTYALVGQTTLATLGSINPVFVQFNISENEYLKFMAQQNNMTEKKAIVTIKLSDGQDYPIPGTLAHFDRSLSENTGTLTVKALFDNPSGVLLPEMFARVKVQGETVSNAILVPQRAVQQLLNKSFVIVVGDDGKAESRAVTLGEKVGSYYIIKAGIKPDDKVVIEGLTKLQAGMDLNVTMVTPEEMKFSLTADNEENSNVAGSSDLTGAKNS